MMTCIDWSRDFSWTVTVLSSADYPVDCRLFNRLPADLRAGILGYLWWTEEMRLFELFPCLVHPWSELNKIYRKEGNWTLYEMCNLSGQVQSPRVP